jgi:Secretion system C-terminal sorting domain
MFSTIGTQFVLRTALLPIHSMSKSKHCRLLALSFFCFFFSYSQMDVPSANTADENFFSQFTCTLKGSNAVAIEWKTSYFAGGDYFIVERSADGLLYETLSALKIKDTSCGHELMDNAPLSGSFFYRIKWIGKSGKEVYSKIQLVNVLPDVDFKFYPNPTDKLLIIRTGHAIDVQILDASGASRLTRQIQAGIQIINVSSLEKGNYVLKVADRESNRVVSEQLVKN